MNLQEAHPREPYSHVPGGAAKNKASTTAEESGTPQIQEMPAPAEVGLSRSTEEAAKKSESCLT